MKRVIFSVICTATYSSELEIPNDIEISTMDDLVQYINDNLDDAPVRDLEWMSDLDHDAVIMEDIFDLQDENDNSILDTLED